MNLFCKDIYIYKVSTWNWMSSMDPFSESAERYISELKNPYRKDIIADVKKEVQKPLSDADIRTFFGGNETSLTDRILKVSELSKTGDLDDLFSGTFDYRIILQVHTQENSGHWIAILKYKDGPNTVYEYFDPYGKEIGHIISKLPKSENIKFGQHPDFLRNLFIKKNNERLKNTKVIYNDYPFQNSRNDISSCGRWGLLRILLAEHFGFNLQEFADFIIHLKKNVYIHLSMDEICSLLIDIAV